MAPRAEDSEQIIPIGAIINRGDLDRAIAHNGGYSRA
jgi:hypothetical protein